MTTTHPSSEPAVRIDDDRIRRELDTAARPDPGEVRDLLAKSRELKGLRGRDLAVLAGVTDPSLLDELFHTAREVKEAIYGKRLVLFAPLYISNLCANECTYCAFRARNTALVRRALTQEEIAREVRWLEEQGHKRILFLPDQFLARNTAAQLGIDYFPADGDDAAYAALSADSPHATKRSQDSSGQTYHHRK